MSKELAELVRLMEANETQALNATYTKGWDMRTAGSFLVAVTLAVLTMAQAEQKPQDILGWRDARWGMTMDEVRNACPEVQSVRDKKDLLVISNLDIAGSSFEAKFVFSTDTKLLRNILLTITDPNATSRGMGCAPFDRVTAALMEKYGQPASTVSNENGKKVTWLFPSTTIYLSCTSMALDYRSLRVVPGYSRSETPPVQYLDTLVIDYGPPEKTTAKNP